MDVLQAVKDYYTAVTTPEEKNKQMIADFAATVRLYPYMRGLREQFKADPSSIQENVEVQSLHGDEALTASVSLEEQWKVQQRPYSGDRSTPDLPMDEEEAFSLKAGEWTSVKKRANGNLSFFRVEEHKNEVDSAGVMEKVMRAQREMSFEAQDVYMKKLVAEMREKNALSLEYLNPAQEPEE